MTQFWKRGIALLLVLVSVCGLCACGAEQATGDNKDGTVAGNETTTNNQETTEQNNNVPFKLPAFRDTEVSLLSAEPYEDENVKIEITKLEYSPQSDENGEKTEHGCCLIIRYTVENRSSEEMTMQAEMASVNGFSCGVVDADDTKVQAGETKELYMYVPEEQFIRNGISQIGSGKVVIKIYGDTFRKYRANVSFTARENFEQRKYTDGQVVYEKDGLKIVAQGHGKWSTWEFDSDVRFYVENNSDKTYSVSIEKYVHPDGYDLDTPVFLNEIVQPGEAGHVYGRVYDVYNKGYTNIAFRIRIAVERDDTPEMFYFKEVEIFQTEFLSIEPITIEQ